MRRRQVVGHDVAEPKRLRQPYCVLNGFRDPVQCSVLDCDLGAVEQLLLEERLTQVLNLGKDRVLIVHLGSTAGATTSYARCGRPSFAFRGSATGLRRVTLTS